MLLYHKKNRSQENLPMCKITLLQCSQHILFQYNLKFYSKKIFKILKSNIFLKLINLILKYLVKNIKKRIKKKNSTVIQKVVCLVIIAALI